jgi:hypothetical protein
VREFKRGISDKFVDALKRLAAVESWWRDVILDKTLIIGVRDEYLNVYWMGQSVFRITMRNDGTVSATTHPKYLLEPSLSKQVSFDGKTFDLDSLAGNALIHQYESSNTLKKLKTAAAIFSQDEKRGVHAVVLSNDNVVDVEVAMVADESLDIGRLPRADIAAFEEDNDVVRLALWEAKTFYNPELKLSGRKNVVGQIQKYKSVVASLRLDIINSYTRVAANLRAFDEMSAGHRSISQCIRDVTDGKKLTIRSPADVGLIVFGFDAAQKMHVWEPLQAELVKVELKRPVKRQK